MAFVIRFGTGVLPEPRTVIQAGDQVYLLQCPATPRATWPSPLSRPRKGSGNKVAIAGAGAVGRSIALQLVEKACRDAHRPQRRPEPDRPGGGTGFGDACELSLLATLLRR